MQIERRGFLSGMGASLCLLHAGQAQALARSHAPRFGIQTYSFRDMLPAPGDMVDKMIAGCKAVGLDMIELFEPSIQPPSFSVDAPWAVKDGKPTEASLFGRPPEGPRPAAAEERLAIARKWRLETPLTHFLDIGRRFRKAGITVQAFNFGLKDSCTDEEVDRGFEITKALGCRIMTASTTLTMLQRTVPFVARHKILLGLHGHSNLRDPNQLATPESFEKGLAMSPWYRLNFDIGHFAAAGFDTIAFLEKHKAQTVSIHLKDRKANLGANMPFGQGDTPIAEVIRFINRENLSIPMMLEYEYAGGNSVSALKEMLSYCEKSVNS